MTVNEITFTVSRASLTNVDALIVVRQCRARARAGGSSLRLVLSYLAGRIIEIWRVPERLRIVDPHCIT